MAKEIIKKEDDSFDFDIIITALFTAVLMALLIQTLPVFQNANAYYQSQLYEGENDPRTLNATPTKQSLLLSPPWISVYFFNDGPDLVFININTSTQPLEILIGESLTIDMSGAERRIETIDYYCNPTKTAVVRVIGKY